MIEETNGVDMPADVVKIENFEGFGDITVGVGSNWHKLVTALCLLNNPNVNKFFLAEKLKLSDRITKTKLFPREGMSLPNGEVYHGWMDKIQPFEKKDED